MILSILFAGLITKETGLVEPRDGSVREVSLLLDETNYLGNTYHASADYVSFSKHSILRTVEPG